MRTCLLLAIVLLAPPAAAEPAAPPVPSDADYAAHAAALRKRLPADFTVLVERPFVVIGDEKPAMVQRRATGTVRWAVARLKKQYFKHDPPHIIDIYLFRDAASYDKHCRSLFSRAPHTPFGFYSPQHRALIMNIATGGGTLVHEIVHPFVAVNFPQCPAWLNEGLGSLYEQSSSRDGKIVGLTNWRLAGLQKTIRAGILGSFEALCSTTTDEFYGDNQGTNYAQARYLCYYLQEQGLLEKFYHQFAADVATDPTGYNTLKAVLGREDMTTFGQQWQRYVLGLRFP